MNTRAAHVLGYTDVLHVAPGGTIRAHLHAPGAVDVRLVELASDPVALRRIASAVDGQYSPGIHALLRGSCMRVSGGVPVPAQPTASLWIWPTRPARGEEQALLSWGLGHGLFLTAGGHVEARWAGGRIATRVPVLARRWHEITFVTSGKQLGLTVTTRDGGQAWALPTTDYEQRDSAAEPGTFCLAAIAAGNTHECCFDGKIADPCIRDGDEPIAAWALGERPESLLVSDTSGKGRHGTLINRPQKGMTGPHWKGDSVGWRDAPAEYNAIAFHRDDLSDAMWPVTFSFSVPDDLPSGAYGFELHGSGERDVLPFFVTPRPGQTSAPVAFVVPLFSYLAYANERHWWTNPAVEQIAGAPLDQIIGPLERWGEANELLSAYDWHSDGTGNAHVSIRRPLVNVRPDYVHPLLRGPHQLSGDMLTLEWLRSIGQPVDVITDYCLHERGVAALKDYRCVITGSHPEYCSAQVLDAYEGYLDGGGNLLHLGGNAFYFVVSVYGDEPHVMETRRGVGGTIPWQAEPGEARHASTGELGGLWRWRGRSAHALVGTGTSVVSFGKGRPYVITKEARERDDLRWIFEGVSGDEIDAPGVLFGGAAGFELDALRDDLGTPANTIKLAEARDFGALSFLALEDVIGTGPRAEALSHLAYRRLRSGGQVFSAPSVAWTSCLSANGGQNAVATVTGNVLRRFLSNEEAR